MEGVTSYNYSNPCLGVYGQNNGYNSIANNTDVNLYAYNNCTISAQENYWENPFNVNKIYAGAGSTVNYSYYSLTDYCSGGTRPVQNGPGYDGSSALSKSSVGNTQSPNEVNGKSDLLSMLFEAKTKIIKGDYKAASDACKQIINNNIDSSAAFYALTLLREAGVEYNQDDLLAYLTGLTKLNKKNNLSGLAEIMLSDFNKKDYVKLMDAAIEKYKGLSIVEQMLFGKFIYYFNEINDTTNAKNILGKIDELFSGSMSSKIGHELLEPVKQLHKDNSEKSYNNQIKQIPTEFNLEQNYPNPFNPVTTINYSLPVDSKVKLAVYNSLGQEVALLVDNVKTAGMHNAIFNAAHLSSGVYFYSLTAQPTDGSRKDYQSNKKMLLIK